jgi:hypothetical protein
MGKSHINAYRKIPGVRITALCDVDTRVLDWGKQDFAKRNEKVVTYGRVPSVKEIVDLLSGAPAA